MINLILILVLVAIVGGAAAYIIRAKKSGAKCIGCPSGGCSSKQADCGRTCSGCCGACREK